MGVGNRVSFILVQVGPGVLYCKQADGGYLQTKGLVMGNPKLSVTKKQGFWVSQRVGIQLGNNWGSTQVQSSKGSRSVEAKKRKA